MQQGAFWWLLVPWSASQPGARAGSQSHPFPASGLLFYSPPLGLDTMNYGFAVGLVEFFFFACGDRSRVLCRVRGSISIHPSGSSEPQQGELLLAAGAGCHVHSILLSS